MSPRHRIFLCTLLIAICGVATAAFAQTEYDPPGIDVAPAGHGRIAVTITAGQTGAPEGFTLWWMTRQQYNNYGGYWPETPIVGEGTANFTGTSTLHMVNGEFPDFQLGPGESVTVYIGGLFDETGVDGEFGEELKYGTNYVVCAYANGGPGYDSSQLSLTLGESTTLSTNCTYTVGYWKNHGPNDPPNLWPVTNLTLGTVNYTDVELQSILDTPAAGNGLISLAHQLIAAKLNIANGADPSSISATIAAADALIGGLVVPPVGGGFLSPGSTSALNDALTNYNEGLTGPGHCGEVPTHSSTWGSLKALYR